MEIFFSRTAPEAYEELMVFDTFLYRDTKISSFIFQSVFMYVILFPFFIDVDFYNFFHSRDVNISKPVLIVAVSRVKSTSFPESKEFMLNENLGRLQHRQSATLFQWHAAHIASSSATTLFVKLTNFLLIFAEFR